MQPRRTGDEGHGRSVLAESLCVYAVPMARKSYEVKDGPLEGQVYALDVTDKQELHFKLDDGRTAIYRVHRWDPESPSSTRDHFFLFYVGVDPFA
jgi:hypothetical protein